MPLHPELVELLASWTTANLEHIRRRKRLIADSRGSLDRHLIGRIVHRIGRAAGVPGVHPHRLRHTYGTELAAAGIDLLALRQLMGHASPETTARYVHLSAEHLAAEYAAAHATMAGPR